MKNLSQFFSPKSIAIVGASPKKEKLGNVLEKNIADAGWKGKLYLVNPKYKRIGQNRCYSSLGEIGRPVDLVLVAIPAQLVNQTVAEGASARPKITNFVIISSGFKEAGKEGCRLEKELEILAKKDSLNLLGPNCLGFINPHQKLNATFTSGKFRPGKVSIISQSGALAVALLDWTQGMSVGFSKVISIGNKAVLDESDIAEYLAADGKTKAIAMYLEDIGDGQKFREKIGFISGKMPVVVIKAGKNKAGQKAISSHTGSLAQDNDVLQAVLEKLNIINLDSIKDFQNVILFLDSGMLPEKEEIVIVTNAGGPGVLASDMVGESKTLKLAKIPEKIKDGLKKYLPQSASVENPIDIIGDATPKRYDDVLKILSGKFSKNPLLVILTPQSQSDPEGVAMVLKKYKSKFSSLTAVFMGGEKISPASERLKQVGIASFGNPEEALRTIEKISKYEIQRKKKKIVSRKNNIRLKLGVNRIIQEAIKKKRKILYWNESEKIFRSYGVNLAKSVNFKKLKGTDIPKSLYPCVLKTDDPKIIHRWEKKAVYLNIQNEKEMSRSFKRMQKETGATNYLVQSMAKKGFEMIVGLKRDESFGPVIVAGLGGTFTEIFKDRSIMIPPLSENEIKERLKKLSISPILRGFRKEKGYRMEEIVKIVNALQEIAAENPDISQIDINPIILYNSGEKYQILDAKVYLG